MIELTANEGGTVEVNQWATHPMLYLDHWALRKISEDSKPRERFVRNLIRREGTLALSWLNLAEFARVTPPDQAQIAEAFVESILPRVYFLEVDPFTVTRRQDALLIGARATTPPGDAAMLRAFVLGQSRSVSPLTAQNLFKTMQNRRLVPQLERFADTIVSRVSLLRAEHGADRQFRRTVRRTPSRSAMQNPARILIRELVRTLLVDQGTKMTRNHAVDLVHAVVPLVCCDVVLLDKHWEAQVEKVRARLKKAGLSARIATVFSGKDNGVDRCLEFLEEN